MKKIAAMTAIIALVSMPVLAAGQGGFTGRIHRTVDYHYHPGWRLHRAERRGDHRGERQVAA